MDLLYEKDGCQVLYRDRDILVCFKRAGLAVQSARLGERDMVSILKTWLREKNPAAGEPYLGIVHRLDQPVRGLVLFALNKKSAASLSAQLNNGRMEKHYLAKVRLPEQLPEAEGSGFDNDRLDPERSCPGSRVSASLNMIERTLVDYLVKEAGSNLSKAVPEGSPGAKRAELIYRVVRVYKENPCRPEALLEIRLLTGRHHQIRVQLAHAGMPIIGDRKYAPENGTDSTRFPLLCAWKLGFDHPTAGKWMEFSADTRQTGF